MNAHLTTERSGTTSASFAHVVDRWFDEPAVATAPGER